MIQIKKKEFYKIFKYLEICVRVVYYKKNISTAALLYILCMSDQVSIVHYERPYYVHL